MIELEKLRFDVTGFLGGAGFERRLIKLAPKEILFSQGDPADSVFYLEKGRAKVMVVSATGKEATIMLLSAGDFAGEEALAATVGLRLATAAAITACSVLRISPEEMTFLLHGEPSFSDIFLRFLLERSLRVQADLVDHLFNSCEKRLARILLLMAEFSGPGEPDRYIPKISQKTLAEMIGTTRSRVSFFMNRFRNLVFIEYSARITVHKSLLGVFLFDQLPEHNAEKPAVIELYKHANADKHGPML